MNAEELLEIMRRCAEDGTPLTEAISGRKPYAGKVISVFSCTPIPPPNVEVVVEPMGLTPEEVDRENAEFLRDVLEAMGSK